VRSQLAFAIGVLTCCLFGPPAMAGKRVALVIGNSAYQNVAQLPNPIKDAAAIADMFKKAGFDVVENRQNLKNADTRRALNSFFDKVRDADIAVVYYAGHGIEIDGTNYIVPVDALLERDRDAFDEAVSLDRIVQSIEPARQLRLIILDACRDNPFAKNTRRTLATRGVGRGLARVDPDTPNTLVAFAAKAGSTADDGFGEHSPFATSLLKYLTVPGLDLRRALGRVRDEVMISTGNRQEPFVFGSLGGEDVSLVPAPEVPVAAAAAAQNPAEIRADYQLAERIGTKEAWDYFIAAHDGGFYADLAKAQRNKIAAEKAKNSIVAESSANSVQQKQAAVTPVDDQGKFAVASVALPPESSQSGAKVGAIDPHVATPGRESTSKEAPDWDKVKDSSDQSALTGFIKRYPNSPLSINAQQRLDVLKRAADEREAAAAQARADAALKLAAAAEERVKLAAAERAKLEETQFAEAKRREQQRVAEDQGAKEEQRRRQVAALAVAPLSTEHDPNAQPSSDQVCKEAAAKLAKLRISPTPEDVARFEKDLACEQLRPQLVRLRESIPANILPRPDVVAPIERPGVDEPEKAAPPTQRLSIQTPQESPVEKPQVNPSIPRVVTTPPPRPQNKAASAAERRRVTSADCKAINERAQLGDMSDDDRETLKSCRGGMRP
jgi:hypothetical protein